MYEREDVTSMRMIRLENAVTPLSEVLRELKKTGLEIEPTLKNLSRIAQEGSEGVKNILAEKVEPKKILGIMQSRRKVIDTLDLPELFAFDDIRRGYRAGDANPDPEYLEVNKDEVKLKADAIERIKEKNKVYAETKQQRNRIEAMERLRDAAIEMKAQGLPVNLRMDYFLVFHVNGDIEINRDNLKSFINR